MMTYTPRYGVFLRKLAPKSFEVAGISFKGHKVIGNETIRLNSIDCGPRTISY